MILSYFTISNYRSIQGEYKIDLSNYITLIGKNNEGKTNVIKAINLGMEIIKISSSASKRKTMSSFLYNWLDDYPITLQSKSRVKKKVTKLRMDFTLNEQEQSELNNRIDSHINESLSVFIEIDESNHFNISIPKRGKNAKALSKKVLEITSFIVESFDVQYIPAIRSEDDAYNVILGLIDTELASIQDEEYKNALEIIEIKQRQRLDILENNIAKPLRMFLPSIKNVHINLNQNTRVPTYRIKRSIDVEIDDGVSTSLSRKGDGVKSLSVIALLSELTSEKNILILVDEPESHLHPDAIRYINTVLHNLANRNQVIISTHSPIFVNRLCIPANIIVDNGKASPAKRLEEVRKTLGVVCSDNLMYSDYVLIVEGPSDKTVLEAFLMQDETIKNWLLDGYLIIRSIGGTNNLRNEVYNLVNYCCKFMIVLDYDPAGKEASDSVKKYVEESNIVFFKAHKNNHSELEDMIKPEIYKEVMDKYHIDISKSEFKNMSKKWVDRIKSIYIGGDLSTDMENALKTDISKLVSENISDAFTESGLEIMTKIKDIIKSNIAG